MIRRAGRALGIGVVISFILVVFEITSGRASLDTYARVHHQSVSTVLLSGFVSLTLLAALAAFALLTVFRAASRSARRPAARITVPARQPWEGAYRGTGLDYGGRPAGRARRGSWEQGPPPPVRRGRRSR